MKKTLLYFFYTLLFIFSTNLYANGGDPCDNANLSVVATTVDVACFGEASGQANITMTERPMPYTLEIWTNLPVFGWTPYVVLTTDTLEIVGTSPTGNWDPTGLIGPAGTLYSGPYAPAGEYFGVMTDLNGCTVTSDTSTIGQPDALNVFVTTSPPTCNGYFDAEANITIEGGTQPWILDIWTQIPFFGFTPYTSLSTDTLATIDVGGGWDPLGALGIPNTLYSGPQAPAGVYFGTVTDANGCYFSSDTVTITEPEPIEITVNTIDASASGENDGTATINITGGTPPYNTDWQGNDPLALASGTYVVSVTDSNMCEGSTSFTIETLAINEINNYNINLFPNPTTSILTIEFINNKTQVINMELVDYIGRSVINNIYNHELPFGKSNITLNLSNLNSGVYYLKVANDTQQIAYPVIVK